MDIRILTARQFAELGNQAEFIKIKDLLEIVEDRSGLPGQISIDAMRDWYESANRRFADEANDLGAELLVVGEFFASATSFRGVAYKRG